MPEEYELDKPQEFDLSRYLDIARRRYMHFLLPLLGGFLLVWGGSWTLKPRYKSTTVILVEPEKMPKNYVLPNVSEDALQAQLASISQQLQSRTRLLAIRDKLHLFPGVQNADAVVGAMTKGIAIQLVKDPNGGEIAAFSVSYSASDRHVAQSVTRDLSDGLIEESLRIRQQQSQSTTSFLESQLQAASENLQEQEAKVRAYEATHEGALPSQQQSNITILAGLQTQLQSEQDALNTAMQQRAYDQSMIEQYRSLRGPVKTSDGSSVDVAALDQALEKERAQLADLRSRYTDSYPDVQALKVQIARTEKERDQALVASKAARNSVATDTRPTAVDPTQNSPLAQLQGQLHANEIEITNREHGISQLKARIDQYQGRLGAEPASEQAMADLTRGYNQSKENYDELLKKRDDSQMATSMEQMQQGEQFSILDPPSLPLVPDFPNHLKFCAAGLAAGLFFGIASVAGFEFMDDRLFSEKTIASLLPVPVISEIPQIVSDADQRAGRRRAFLGWATGAVVFVIILFGAAVSVLHP